jgi:hypothetical protein
VRPPAGVTTLPSDIATLCEEWPRLHYHSGPPPTPAKIPIQRGVQMHSWCVCAAGDSQTAAFRAMRTPLGTSLCTMTHFLWFPEWAGLSLGFWGWIHHHWIEGKRHCLLLKTCDFSQVMSYTAISHLILMTQWRKKGMNYSPCSVHEPLSLPVTFAQGPVANQWQGLETWPLNHSSVVLLYALLLSPFSR